MKYNIWLKTAAVFQFSTAILHSVSLIVPPAPGNETEQQLLSLMENYKMDLGAGFHRSLSELTIALSACFSLVCLLGGWLNWYLLKKDLHPELMQGVITINLIVFGVCFALMLAFTFLPPVIMTGLIFLFLVLARIAVSKTN